MFRIPFLVVLAPLLACAPYSSTSASTTSTPAVDGPPDPSPATTLTYDDVLGESRSIPVELRLPEQQGDQLVPVVVWSHGGGQGKRSTKNVGERWGRAFNEAGIAFVAIAHTGRSDDGRLAVCDAVGASDCSMFSSLRWDRPHDIAATIDWVEAIAPQFGLAADRIAIGGHSGGARGVLNTAGLTWEYDSELQPAVDERPVAVLAASPPGAATRSIDDDDVAALDVPMIWLSGAGDTTGSTPAFDRRVTFEILSSDHEAVLFWADREEIRHGGFNLDVASCQRAGGTRHQCRQAVRSIADVGVSFVERVLRSADSFDVDRFVAVTEQELGTWATLERAG